MRILFASDLQLEAGAPLGNGSEYGDGSRFAEQQLMLDQVVGLADQRKVAMVCILGDVFELRKPSPWAVLAFQDFVRQLRLRKMEVIIIRGNHDLKSEQLPSSLELFSLEAHYADVPSLYPFDEVVLAVLPWAPINNLIAKQQGSRSELHALAEAGLVHAAHFLRARCQDEHPGKKAILLGHWAISGAMLPSGLGIETTLHEPIIPLEALIESNYDLAAFGHIHKAQVLSESPPIFYAGSAMICNWGETLVPHGVWLYDSEGPLLEFEPLPGRPFLTVQIHPGNSAIEDPAFLRQVPDAAVRVRYTASEEEAKLHFDHTLIRELLLDAGARKVIIQPTIVRAERARMAELTESLGPDEAMRMWLDSQQIVDEQPIFAAHSEYVQALR